MATPEHLLELDPNDPYEDPQGEVYTDASEVPGRIRRATDRMFRRRNDLTREIKTNPQIGELLDDLHTKDFHVVAQGIVDNIVFTVQKHKKPIIGITAAAITAGAVYHEITRGYKDEPEEEE